LVNGVALLAGLLSVAGFAPYSLFWLPILALSGMLLIWNGCTPRRAAVTGWWYGLGLMGGGVYWMHISIAQFGGVSLPLALLLTLLFVTAAALYFALVGWGWRILSPNRPGIATYLLLFPALWLLVEWLRGWLFSGFPWLWLGYAQIDSPLAGYAPLIGVLGVGGIAATMAGGTAWLLRAQGRVWPAWLLLITLPLAGHWLGNRAWTEDSGERLEVAMVQGNIAQSMKWRPEEFNRILETYVSLTLPVLDKDLVIWPETAIPAFAGSVDELLLTPLEERIRQQGSRLLLGLPMQGEDGRYYNAMLQLGGESRSHYHKRHLVPFGEFMPLRPLLEPITDWLRIPMSDFAPGQAERPLLDLGKSTAGLSICYEDAFGNEVRQALPQAGILINASNDAWFGDSIAPHQHLEIARMRALEGGRWLLRSTNTGISALIDHRGKVLATSPQFLPHRLEGVVEIRRGATPYVRFGDWWLVLGALLVVLGGLARGKRSKQQRP
jgi:apolipoprotein N-acyltransferase